MPEPEFRFAFVSAFTPPHPSGQAAVIGRLLGGVPTDRVRLLSPAGEFQFRRGTRFGVQVPNAAMAIAHRARHIVRELRTSRCRVIVAASGDPWDLPAAALAARRIGAAFVPYYFDDYTHQHWDPTVRWITRRLEPRFLRQAARVLVPNEAMGEALERRFRVATSVVRNPCDVDAYPDAAPPDNHPPRIVFTGALAESNEDAIRNLVDVLETTPFVLHLYTAQPPEAIAGLNASLRVRVHAYQPIAAMPGIQQSADVLFLPLAFQSRYPEVIQTSTPAKLGEYLASGRPILAHVPDNTFLATFLRERRCAFVVSEKAGLVPALQRILADDEGTGRRARAVARAEFEMEACRRQFLQALAEVVEP